MLGRGGGLELESGEGAPDLCRNGEEMKVFPSLKKRHRYLESITLANDCSRVSNTKERSEEGKVLEGGHLLDLR